LESTPLRTSERISTKLVTIFNSFSFGASAALNGQPSSLQMMPALEVPMIGKH